MKKILLAILVLTSITAKAQFYLSSLNGSYGGVIVESHYDTTVLYKGEATCHHSFVAKRQPLSLTACDVIHGAAGCPDTWYDNYEICTKCLKHIHVKETRTVEEVKDAYEEALDKLKLRKQ